MQVSNVGRAEMRAVGQTTANPVTRDEFLPIELRKLPPIDFLEGRVEEVKVDT